MLSVLSLPFKKRGGEYEETFGGDGYAYFLDCDDGFKGL